MNPTPDRARAHLEHAKLGFIIAVCLSVALLANELRKPIGVRQPMIGTSETERVVDRADNSVAPKVSLKEFARTVEEMQQKTLMGNVLYACVYRYHRDTCLHHYITCGEKCRDLISPSRFAQMERDFWNLMRERNLVPQMLGRAE